MTQPEDTPIPPTQRWLEALGCGTLVIDSLGQIVYANQHFCEIAGHPASTLVGRRLESLHQPGGDGDLVVERLKSPAGLTHAEYHIIRPDGRRVPVIVSGHPLKERADPAEYQLVTVVDITRHKMAEDQLREHYQTISRLSDTVLAQAIELKHYSENLEEKVRERTAELEVANMEAIFMLAVASEAKDGDTGAHVLRIRRYTELLAREIGLPTPLADRYGYSAILHDVGKMIVPDEILKKPGRLSGPERQTMQEHTVAGERILSKKPFFDLARQIARSHHEDWNGDGYPDGKRGAGIPQAARIVRVADVYDALVSRRVYKPAWSPNEAAEAIAAGEAAQFDPEVVGAFRRLFQGGAFDPSGMSADR